jgi:hypothetical protein
MAFACPIIACMARMAMAFIDHLKFRGLESLGQPLCDFIAHGHFSLPPLLSAARTPKLSPPSRKGLP